MCVQEIRLEIRRGFRQAETIDPPEDTQAAPSTNVVSVEMEDTREDAEVSQSMEPFSPMFLNMYAGNTNRNTRSFCRCRARGHDPA